MGISCIVRTTECDGGATAVEFAILAPIFIMLLVGTVSGGLLMSAASSLNYATERAARCFSVSVGQCPDAPTTQTYALGLYSGPSSPAPTFTASTPACGHQVIGGVSFTLDAGVAQWSIPLSATACFP
jgi:TadE-like protein